VTLRPDGGAEVLYCQLITVVHVTYLPYSEPLLQLMKILSAAAVMTVRKAKA
jgi:hypothetical protein